MQTYIPEEKQRLRDEAELAMMAWREAGREPTRLRPSLAPVCVPERQSRPLWLQASLGGEDRQQSPGADQG